MIYYSVRTRQALKNRLARLPLGLPHYSYGIVCGKFLRLFEEIGVEAVELPMPEIFPSYREARRSAFDQPRPVHVMFKAFDEFRLLKGAYNIAHVAWNTVSCRRSKQCRRTIQSGLIRSTTTSTRCGCSTRFGSVAATRATRCGAPDSTACM